MRLRTRQSPSSQPRTTVVGRPGRSLELCFPTHEGALIGSELEKPPVRGCERSVLALVGLTRMPNRDSILVRKVVVIPEDAYFPMRAGSAWSPLVTGAALSRGMQMRAGLLLVHAHPGDDAPRLSGTDRTSFEQLLPRCLDLLPEWPHGSVVIGDRGAVGGLAWLPGSRPGNLTAVDSARWIGSPIVRSPPLPMRTPRRATVYDRQEMLIGSEGQSMLGQATLGVVGLGGGGSHMVQQAAHMGFGRLVLVDPDRVEETNLSRLVGAGPSDVGRLKTEVMADLVRRINPDVAVDLCSERLPSAESIERVKACDLLVVAVDSHTARSEVQKVAWRYLLPLIDVGFGTRVRDDDGSGRIEAIAGHVHVYLPGGPCMWCSDLVTEAKLAEERGGHAVPYIEGVAAPQVIHFNGLLASQAMVEAMQVATGFLPFTGRPGFYLYRGMTGEMVRFFPERRQDCPICETELGAGDTVW